MIHYIRFDGRVYRLANPNEVNSSQNVYSIVVGKNGTGKSRLLKAIVSGFNKKSQSDLFDIFDGRFAESDYHGISADSHPTKIIAISTSPFDKFPVPGRGRPTAGYTYLGVRDVSTLNVGVGYMSKIVSKLMESLNDNYFAHWEKVSMALTYLGYSGALSVTFGFSNVKRIREDLEDRNEELFRVGYGHTSGRSLNSQFFVTDKGKLDYEKIDRLKYYLTGIESGKYPVYGNKVSVTFHDGGVNLQNRFQLSDIIFLLNCGYFRLRNVEFSRGEAFQSHLSIVDSSSGQQSIILGILGIVSQIQNGSVVCIDEPELSLHPEWQEKYIQLLIQVFSHFTGCHFIIATHSPQIVSKLDSHNCYLIDIETAETVNANYVINNSIDFQLVNVFKTPGYRNEYLSRIAYSVFTKVARNKRFDEEDLHNYQVLDVVFSKLSREDPLVDIIELIRESYNTYARN